MSYVKDGLWIISKAIFRGTKYENDWVHIMTYYNVHNGRILSMYCTPEENQPVRVLGKLDDEDKVLTINENGRYKYYSNDQIKHAPKVFNYADEEMTKRKRYHLKDGKINGKVNFYYYVAEGE